MTDEEQYLSWLNSLPPAIHKIAKEYPFGRRILLEGVMHYVMGCMEDKETGVHHKLVLSRLDPFADKDKASEEENLSYVCVACMDLHFDKSYVTLQ